MQLFLFSGVLMEGGFMSRTSLTEERQRFLCCQADDHRHWVSDGDEVFGSFLGGNGSKASMNGSGGTSCPKSPSASRTGQLQRIQKTLELLSLSPLTPSLRKKSRRGAAPGSRLEWLLLEKKGSYDFRRYLRRLTITREETKPDLDSFDYIPYCYGLSQPEKFLFLEPLEYRENKRIREFVIAIDTSGSCQGKTVERFLRKTYSILKSSESYFERVNIHIIQCDEKIQRDVKVTTDEEFEQYMQDVELCGFGGTDFRPVFEYVDGLIRRHEFQDLKGLIYFTDGQGTFPERMPDYQTAFVFIQEGYSIPEVPVWAIRLILDEEDV